jgi:hypothetical protein
MRQSGEMLQRSVFFKLSKGQINLVEGSRLVGPVHRPDKVHPGDGALTVVLAFL